MVVVHVEVSRVVASPIGTLPRLVREDLAVAVHVEAVHMLNLPMPGTGGRIF